jgi:hypothetical protein
MEQLNADESHSLLEWCRTVKGLIHSAVLTAGGKTILQSRLGKLDCRGKRTRKVAQSCSVTNELHAVVRPNLAGDNFRTIHKAKGIQREAILVFARDVDEFESWVFSPDITRDESSRRGYVAFSRARKILCICCETLSAKHRGELEARNVELVVLGEHQLKLF